MAMHVVILLLLIFGVPPPAVPAPAKSIASWTGDAASEGDIDPDEPESRCEKAADRAPTFRIERYAGALHRPG